jgi:hypothetical protein
MQIVKLGSSPNKRSVFLFVTREAVGARTRRLKTPRAR